MAEPPPISNPSFSYARALDNQLIEEFRPQQGTSTHRPKLGFQHLGEPGLRFTIEECERLEAPLKWTLIGKFSRSRPQMDRLRRDFQTAAFKGRTDINLLDNHQVLITFALPEDYYRCWLHKVWNFGSYSLRITKWVPNFNPRTDSPIVPVWVSLYGLPQQFFDEWAMLSIGNLLGKPIKVDKATLNRTRPHVARVCVEIDLTKTLIGRVWIDFRESGFWQYVEYDGLPEYCSTCLKLGHLSPVCRSDNSASTMSAWRPSHNPNHKGNMALSNDEQRRPAGKDMQPSSSGISIPEKSALQGLGDTQAIFDLSKDNQKAQLEIQDSDITNSSPQVQSKLASNGNVITVDTLADNCGVVSAVKNSIHVMPSTNVIDLCDLPAMHNVQSAVSTDDNQFCVSHPLTHVNSVISPHDNDCCDLLVLPNVESAACTQENDLCDLNVLPNVNKEDHTNISTSAVKKTQNVFTKVSETFQTELHASKLIKESNAATVLELHNTNNTFGLCKLQNPSVVKDLQSHSDVEDGYIDYVSEPENTYEIITSKLSLERFKQDMIKAQNSFNVLIQKRFPRDHKSV